MTREQICAAVRESAEGIAALVGRVDEIGALCDAVVETLRGGGKVLTAGNGGSAAQALHMAEELVGRFRSDRRPLAAVALVGDPTALTCIGNDFGFDYIFSRQIEALARPGDLLVTFSTSGRARNLSLAVDAAGRCGARTACVLGRDGGALAGRGDCELVVAGTATERIQEAHLLLLHLMLDAVERAFGEEDVRVDT